MLIPVTTVFLYMTDFISLALYTLNRIADHHKKAPNGSHAADPKDSRLDSPERSTTTLPFPPPNSQHHHHTPSAPTAPSYHHVRRHSCPSDFSIRTHRSASHRSPQVQIPDPLDHRHGRTQHRRHILRSTFHVIHSHIPLTASTHP